MDRSVISGRAHSNTHFGGASLGSGRTRLQQVVGGIGLVGGVLCSTPFVAAGQPTATAAPVASEPMPAPILSTDWCALPMCREAEGLRRTGDVAGSLKIYRYIQEEVDVDEKVVRKPLLWYAIAVLHGELQQPQQGMDALRKYQDYIATRPDAELPAGQRREDVERLAQDLRARMGRVRIASKTAGLRVLLDGQAVGVTPLANALPVVPGKHSVQIAGTSAESQEFEVPSGQEVMIWTLPPQSAAALSAQALRAGGTGVDTASASRPRWRIALGTIGIGIGVTMGAFGIAALAADGTCVKTPSMGVCPVETNSAGQPVSRVVDGRATGGSLLAVGILASAAGAVLIALPGKKVPLQAAVRFLNGATLDLAASF